MSAAVIEILEKIKKLPEPEKRELMQSLAQEVLAPPPGKRRRSVSEARTFRPIPMDDLKDHDRWFAEAILESKRGGKEP
jgi:hypothetical protein